MSHKLTVKQLGSKTLIQLDGKPLEGVAFLELSFVNDTVRASIELEVTPDVDANVLMPYSER